MGQIPRVLVLLAGTLAIACGQREAPRPAATIAAADPIPDTFEGFLAAVAPLPFQALVVVYDVRGPAGLEGTMEVLARPGGYRRHNWRLQLPLPGAAPVEIQGSSVTRPDAQWVEEGDQIASVTARPWSVLAQAYVAATPTQRRAVMAAVDGWHGSVAKARVRHPGDVQTVGGIECLKTQVAAQTLCIWEETGLPLKVEGAGFSIEARHVDTRAELGARAFHSPVPVPPSDVVGPAILRSLASGDVTILAQMGCEPACSLQGLLR
jgi:hypothetical protein